MRLILMGLPGPARAPRPSSSPTTSASPRSRPATSSAPTSPQGTPLGVEAKRYMDAGEYVPDEVTNLMVRNRIDEPDAQARLPARRLPAHPRAGRGARRDDRVHRPRRSTPSVVLTVDQDEIVQRLLQRAQVEGRADDTEDVIRRRQEVYVEQTEPLIGVYRERGILRRGRRHGRGRRGHPADLRRARRHPRELSDPVVAFRDRGIEIKTPEQIVRMREAGLVVGETLELLRSYGPRPGSPPASSTRSPRTTSARRARLPSFKGYGTRLPRQHLRLGQRRGRARHPRLTGCWPTGDVISIDCGAIVDGWHGDAAITVAVGDVPGRGHRADARPPRRAMWRGFAAARLGGRVTDISHAVETYVALRAAATASSRTTSATASARRCTSRRTCRTTADPAAARSWSRGSPWPSSRWSPLGRQGHRAARRRLDGRHRRRLLAAHFEHTFTLTPTARWMLTALDGGEAVLGRARRAVRGPVSAPRPGPIRAAHGRRETMAAQEGSIPPRRRRQYGADPGPCPVPSVRPEGPRGRVERKRPPEERTRRRALRISSTTATPEENSLDERLHG